MQQPKSANLPGMDGPDTAHAKPRIAEVEVELKPQQQNMDEPADTASSTPDETSAGPREHSPRRAASAKQPVAPEELCPDQPLESRIEALLMTTDRPLHEAKLAEIIGVGGKGISKRIVEAIEALNQQYESSGRGFRAERLAGGWQILTLSAFGPLLHRLHEKRQETKLSQPALETLSIVAYRQPIMRAEIEAIRGVASGEVLRSLLDRRLVKIVGRAEELGRPMLYGTTTEFLKVFGLSSVDDLPPIKGLNMPTMTKPTAVAAEATSDEEVKK